MGGQSVGRNSLPDGGGDGIQSGSLFGRCTRNAETVIETEDSFCSKNYGVVYRMKKEGHAF